ncbi:MAG: Asp-tRNA(Asn)/Glu-tRNA(Gln) amidotransferase subunit GatC [Alphaproteobacteria bacterium]|nr:Asp-tRNA(Asn)/Glu-tRNA(Gln) amidotransferase subunit GatC [Alphaproteobacteria bacterium]
MSVDTDTVRRIAKLARLAISDDGLAPMAQELNVILGWVDQLNEVDVSAVEPMTSAVQTSLKKRSDTVTDGHIQEAVLHNAPLTEHGFFVVPKVVE